MKHYRPINDDDFENGMLKDGHRYRSGPITMMDHRTDDGPAQLVDGFNNAGLSLRRPGFRKLLGDEIGDRVKEDAYRTYDSNLVSAYRQDAEGGKEGDVCTVRNAQYPLDQGAPGHIVNGICVPDRRAADAASNPDPDDVDDLEQEETERPRRRRRYIEYDPQGRQRSTTVSEEDTARRMQDHQANMARIYEKLDHELSETWRRS